MTTTSSFNFTSSTFQFNFRQGHITVLLGGLIMRVSTAAIRLMAKRTSFPSPSVIPNKSIFVETNSYSPPPPRDYLETFLSNLYFVCLVPFRVKRRKDSGDVIHLERNKFQRVLCFILHSFVVYYQFHEIYSYAQSNVSQDPDEIFNICFAVIDLLYIFSAIHLLWRRQRGIESMLKTMISTRAHFIREIKFRHLKCATLCLLPFFITVLDLLDLVFLREARWSSNLGYFEGTKENDTISKNQAAATAEHTTWTLENLFDIWSFVTEVSNWLLYNAIDAFLTISCVSGYETVKHYAKLSEHFHKLKIHNNESTPGHNAPPGLDALIRPNYILGECIQLKLFFQSINKVTSILFLFWFCSFCPWAAIRLMESLPGLGLWSAAIYNCSIIFYYGVIMGICVETKRMVGCSLQLFLQGL